MSPYRRIDASLVLSGMYIVRKLQRRFETVPLAEVLAGAVEVNGTWDVKNKNDQVAGVPASAGAKTLREQSVMHDCPTAPIESGYTGASPQPGAMEAKTPAKRVLVVDDEGHIAHTLAAILRERGYEAATSYDAISALAQCEASPPDLIITDMVMPGMNGIELAIVVKQLYPSCKILLLSGLATSADFLQEARQNGYDFELLAKPVQLSELLARVAELTRGSSIAA